MAGMKGLQASCNCVSVCKTESAVSETQLLILKVMTMKKGHEEMRERKRKKKRGRDEREREREMKRGRERIKMER